MVKITPSSIIDAARTLLDTPYRYQGRTANKELDCIGLILVTGKIADAIETDFDYLEYARNPDGSLLRELDRKFVPLKEKKNGSVAVFQLSVVPHHCGILSRTQQGNWNLIHAYSSAKKVKEHQLIPWWKSKIVKVYGFPNVDYGC